MDLANNKQMELTRGLGFLAFSFNDDWHPARDSHVALCIRAVLVGAMFEKRMFSLSNGPL